MINWIKEKLGFGDTYACACGFKSDCEDELNSHECFYTKKSRDIMNSIKKSRMKVKITLRGEVDNNVIVKEVTQEQFDFLKDIQRELESNEFDLDITGRIEFEEVEG